MKRYVILASAIFIFATSFAAGGAKKFKSPQEVFEAGKKATAKKDWKGLFACMTDDSQQMMAGAATFVGILVGSFDEKKRPAIERVMKEHGVTPPAGPPKKPKNLPLGKFFRKIGAVVKNKPAYFGKMMKLVAKAEDDEGIPLTKNAKLVDLKIDGDKAKGKIELTRKGKKSREDIEFRRIKGIWLIQIPDPKPGPGVKFEE